MSREVIDPIRDWCDRPVFSLGVGYARFVLAFMMHIQMLPELKQGMNKMKFALNH